MKTFSLLCLAFLAGCSTPPAGAYTSWREVPRHEVAGPIAPPIRWDDGLSLEEFERAAEANPAVTRALFEINQELNRKRASGELVVFGTFQVFQTVNYRPYYSMIGGAIRQTFDIARRGKARKEATLEGKRESAQEKAEVRRWTTAEARRLYWEAVAAQDADIPAEVAATRSAIERVIGPAPEGWTLSDPLPSSCPRVRLDRAIEAAQSRPDLLASAASASEADALAEFAEFSTANDLGFGLGNETEYDDDLIFAQGLRYRPYDFTIEALVFLPSHNVGKLAVIEAERRRRNVRLTLVQALLRREVEEAVAEYHDAVRELRAAPPGLVTAWIVPPAVSAKLRCAVAVVRLEAIVGAPIAEFADRVPE